MSRIESQTRLQIPASLADQLATFRRRVWSTKMAEAVACAAAAVLVAYLVLFALDRWLDTPRTVRWLLAVAAGVGCLLVPYYLHRWVWRNRRFEQLARLLARRLPRVGDQLLGVIELAQSDSEQARSRRLCEAAIEQAAVDTARRDLTAAAPPSFVRPAAVLATLAALGAVALAALYPLAAANAWARLANPWHEVPRYTFAAAERLPAEFVVPHGEDFDVVAKLLPTAEWKPGEATLAIGRQLPLRTALEGDNYQFSAAPQISDSPMQLTIGDWSQQVLLKPMLRPELTELAAVVTLPSYLGRDEKLQLDARGGTASVVKGSQVDLTATISRDLTAAAIVGIDTASQSIEPAGTTFIARAGALDERRELELSWRDEFGLDAKQPFKLAIDAVDDAAPTISCEDLPRRKVVLDSEQLTFQITARDDYGVREIGMAWQGIKHELNPDPDQGEKLLAPGGPEATIHTASGTFSAKSLGIAPQAIELRLYTNDYFPDRQRVYSAPYLLFVLDAEQHAIWVTEQLAKWHRQALEVRDREMRLFETNKQLRELSAAELDSPTNRKRIEEQAAAERANGRRLASLNTNGQELLKQAARNPEIGVGHLERWAEMLQVLSDISANRMPSVADLLKQGADAPRASQMASKPPMSAGADRSTPQGGQSSETKPGEPKPAVPTIVDKESSMQPIDPADGEKPEPKNPSSPTLRLPATTLAGKPSKAPPTPAGDKLDQAIEAQQDLLAEFEKVANELNEVLTNLEGSTLVKRLKAAARQQYAIAGRISDKIDGAFGLAPSRTERDVRDELKDLAKLEESSVYTMSYIMDDMQAYFERRRLVKYRAVLDEMKTEDVLGGLRRLADDIPNEQGLSISQAEFWSDTLDRWAEDIVDPACKGACPGCQSKGSLPPSIVLEVLKILEGEINLREQTRVAEQARPGVEPEQHKSEAERLANQQFELEKRINDVVLRILELPDAETDFGKELALLERVGQVMNEATSILESPNTGAPAVAAETEAIELLLASKRINPNGGGGGGSSPGGGGGGDTKDSALALIGTGLNQKEVRQETSTTQATGDSGITLPEEFRAGLDEYFHQLEQAGG
jgi:hypothetical protein